MQHLSNCPPDAFIPAALEVRPLLMEWLRQSGATEIRRRYPDEAGAAQHAAFLGELLTSAMKRCPGLTEELLRVSTFTPKADFDRRPMRDYLEAALEMYQDGALRDFFTLLAAPAGRTSPGV